MRLKPLVAIATLAVALAGCTVPPQTPVTDQTRTAPSALAPRVTLDVQGLVKAELNATRFTDGSERYFEVGLSDIFYQLAFIVPKGAPEPAGVAPYSDWIKTTDNPAAPYVWADSEAESTHVLYSVDDEQLDDSKAAWLKARFEGEGYEADGLVEAFGNGKVRITHAIGDAAGKSLMPVMMLSPEAPASLVFAKFEEDAIIPMAGLDLNGVDGVDTFNTYRLELDLSVKTPDDQPMEGLTKEYFGLRNFETTPYSHDDYHPTLALEEHGDGQYTLRVGFRQKTRPGTVTVDIGLRNTPLIRDVEY